MPTDVLLARVTRPSCNSKLLILRLELAWRGVAWRADTGGFHSAHHVGSDDASHQDRLGASGLSLILELFSKHLMGEQLLIKSHIFRTFSNQTERRF